MTSEPIKVNSLPIYSLRLIKESELEYPAFQIKNHGQAAAIFQAYLEDRATEHMAVILLDGQMQFLGIITVAMGGISELRVPFRDVLTPCLVHRANYFVLGHNHPSGDVTPSEADLQFTKGLQEAAEMMACSIMDHIIVSSGLNRDSYSFSDHGLL